MNRTLLITAMAAGLITFTAAVALSGTAGASSNVCAVATSERQVPDVLKQKLEGNGWKIRQIKTEDGCYEVYGFDAKGRRVEAYFDPKTLTPVKRDDED